MNFLTILNNILGNKLKKSSVNITMKYKSYTLTKAIKGY